MRALTLHRPWAWALFHGKPVENRSWPCPGALIGEQVAIHAGRTWDEAGAAFVRQQLGIAGMLPAEASSEGVIGVVAFDRVISSADAHEHRYADDSCADLLPDEDPLLHSPWYFGPYGWVHRDGAELATPVPCRGFQRLWTLPPDVEAMVLEQLASSAPRTPVLPRPLTTSQPAPLAPQRR